MFIISKCCNCTIRFDINTTILREHIWSNYTTQHNTCVYYFVCKSNNYSRTQLNVEETQLCSITPATMTHGGGFPSVFCHGTRLLCLRASALPAFVLACTVCTLIIAYLIYSCTRSRRRRRRSMLDAMHSYIDIKVIGFPFVWQASCTQQQQHKCACFQMPSRPHIYVHI